MGAKVIASEGEQKAAKALKEAADVISQSPAALQLRYLQTLNSISAEKNSTIIFPLPMELVGAFTDSDHGELIIIVTTTAKNITNIIITVIFILTKQLTHIPRII